MKTDNSKHMKTLLTIILLASVTACSAQLRLLRQAASFEKAGRYEEAADRYMKALYENATRPESRQGLERTAQKVVDQKLDEYIDARKTGDLERAVESFYDIEDLQKRLTYFKVSVNVPRGHQENYETDRDDYISMLIDEAENHLQRGDRSSAEIAFEKIRKYAPGFDEKDLNSYQKLVSKGVTSISIIPNKNNPFSAIEAFRSSVIAEVAKLDNSAIRVVDRQNLDKIIEEQKLSLSGMIDESSAVELGKILGVKALMIIQIVGYNHVQGQLTVADKTAYTATRDFVDDPVAQMQGYVTNYHPATYREFEQKNLLQASFQYKLVSTETAEVLTADLIHENYVGDVRYAQYEGNYQNLYPSDGSSIFVSGPEREAFLALFTASRRPLTAKELELKMQKIAAEKIARSLDNYFRK